jgi:metal-responsive CopG/Arc/MetJ family transcriptional regulator
MVRTHVVISEGVISEIDRVVGKRRRSRFLEEAAKEKLERVKLEEALDGAFGSITPEDHPHWRNDEAAAEWVRKSRRGELNP